MYKPKQNEWTIEKMIMMGIVMPSEWSTTHKGVVREWDSNRDCVIRAWFEFQDSFYFETVRFVFEKDDGTFGFATSSYVGDQYDDQRQATFQVLQSIEPPR